MEDNIVIFGAGQVGLQLILSINKHNPESNCIICDYYDSIDDKFSELYPNETIDSETSNAMNRIYLVHCLTHNRIKKYLKENRKTYFLICVPTVVKNDYKPNYTNVENALKAINDLIKEDDTILIESSIGIGKTDYLVGKFITEKNINYGFCPERILPDSNLKIEDIDKIISASRDIADVYNFYKTFLRGNIHIANSIKEAESAKLIENIQRDVNIAYLNECKMALDSLGVSFENVLKLCQTKYSWANFTNGLVGGACIPNNSYYLIDSINSYSCKIIELARKTNEYYANYIENKIIDFINNNSINKETNILFLGLGYKTNSTSSVWSVEKSIYENIKNNDCNILHKYDIIDPNVIPISEVDILRRLKESDIIIINGKHDFIKKFKNEIREKTFFDYNNIVK